VPDTEARIAAAERLTRIEDAMLRLDAEVLRNGTAAKEGIDLISAKLDLIDQRWDVRHKELTIAQDLRYKELTEAHAADVKDLATYKARGAGVLTALGVVFTATATIFSTYFSELKHIIFN